MTSPNIPHRVKAQSTRPNADHHKKDTLYSSFEACDPRGLSLRLGVLVRALDGSRPFAVLGGGRRVRQYHKVSCSPVAVKKDVGISLGIHDDDHLASSRSVELDHLRDPVLPLTVKRSANMEHSQRRGTVELAANSVGHG
eukprot:scaffold233993_cov28-Tisochrysis_lutea.AAC.2